MECAEEGICLDGLCQQCRGLTGGLQMMLSNSMAGTLAGDACLCCKRHVTNIKSAVACVGCKKFTHFECDPMGMLSPKDYKCKGCSKYPLVADRLLSSSSNEPTSPFVTTPQQPSMPENRLAEEFTAAVTSHQDLQRVPEDLYQLPAPVSRNQTQSEPNPDHPGPSPSAESESARASPFFQPSDDEEEFKPPGSRTYQPRGRGRGRGSRGKKPGSRGGGTAGLSTIDLMKTRTGGQPPSGIYGDKLGQGTRGKRGKGSRGSYGARGSKGTGTRGRRGRGQLAAGALSGNVMQHLTGMSFTATREVDEQLLEEFEEKQETTMEYVRTALVCPVNDEFLSKAIICLICGSTGKGEEASFICCANCAQAYHTYCVGVHEKIRETHVNRGWRCLDCSICEGCGDGKDESKLLLCDECDTSYHIYCLDPPLQKIPDGPWRCKYCSKCRRCNLPVQTMSELTKEGLCHACSSLRKCTRCKKLYQLNEPLIHCDNCNRWFHGRCEGLFSTEDLDNAVTNRMKCIDCRPMSRYYGQSYGAQGQQMLVVDNVILHREAEEILKSPFVPPQFRPDHTPGPAQRSGSFDFWSNVDDDYHEEVEVPTKDAYPPNIQEGFFGFPGVEGKHLIDVHVEEPRLNEYTVTGQPLKAESGMLSAEQTLQLQHNIDEEGVLENFNFDSVDDLEEDFDFDLLLEEFDQEEDTQTEDGIAEDLKDAFDLVKTEIKSEPVSQPGPSTSSASAPDPSQQPLGPTTFARALNPALSRSSSQLEMSERIQNAATERWEEDEPLGDKATKAAVLYVNINFPNLKAKYPEWNDRVKYIQKQWRILSSEERKKYVEMARENRQQRGKVPRQKRVQSTNSTNSTSLDSPTLSTPPLGHGFPPQALGPQGFHPMAPGQMMPEGMAPPPGPPVHHPRPPVSGEVVRAYAMLRDLVYRHDVQKHRIGEELANLERHREAIVNKREELIEIPMPQRLSSLPEEERAQYEQFGERITTVQQDKEKVEEELQKSIGQLNELVQKSGIPREILNQYAQGSALQEKLMAGRQLPPGHMGHFGMPPPEMGPEGQLMPRPPPRFVRTPWLGTGRGQMLYERIVSPEGRAVYECLDDMLSHVSIQIDGHPQPHLLKRLLENPSTGSGMGPPGMMIPGRPGLVPGVPHQPLPHFPNAAADLEPPKPKKKRTGIKKTGSVAGNNEYDLMLKRIGAHLQHQAFPRRALESVQSRGMGHLIEPGLTELPERLKGSESSLEHIRNPAKTPDPHPLEGEIFAETKFPFTDDIFVAGPPGYYPPANSSLVMAADVEALL
ncbi:unnamed protein product, partial [Mesorhabditis spiculigera]